MRTDPRQDFLQAVGAAVLTGLLLAAAAAPARAEEDAAAPPQAPADLVVSSQVDKTRLTLNEPLRFTVTIAGPITTAPRVGIESLKTFQVLSTGQSQSVTVRGGQTQLAITLEYLLAPLAAGKQTLGPVTVEHEGKRYQTTPIEVEVVAGEHPPLRGGTVL